MALTTSQKNKILRILGYPYGTIDPASLDFSNIIKRKLDRVAMDSQVEVERILQWIDDLDEKRGQAIQQAGVKKIDDIEFTGDHHVVLMKEKNRYVRELSSLLGIYAPALQGSLVGGVCV